MNQEVPAVDSPPGKAAVVMACLPTLLAAVFLFLAESGVDVGLCLVLLLHAPLTLRLSAIRRRRQLFVEMPAILIGTFGVAALLVVSMASLLEAPVPWGQAVGFGIYMAIWVLSLRLIYNGMQWLLERACKKPLLTRIVAAVVMIGFGMPQLFVALQTRRVAIGKQPNVYFAEGAHREIEFANADGLLLRGTLLTQPAREPALQVGAPPLPRPVVIVCHGLGSNRANFFAYAQMAWLQQCHVLAFDFRGHGQSEGVTTTLGGREAGDVVAASRWIRAQPEFAGSPLVLLGISMGGASVMRAAAEAGADGVFTESSFADLSAMLDTRMEGLGPLRHLAAASVRFAAWLQHGVDLDSVSPRDSLAALPLSTKVVLVHAGDDALIPVAHGERLAAARAGQKLHIIEGASHGGCLHVGWSQLETLLQGLLESVRAR
ncbi:MAG: pimeloyl-ACP methyl ester carboxylesterase [Planctomycetota bacterium]|jgi:pimeloyl-ACP methyl ester carboxylesterase